MRLLAALLISGCATSGGALRECVEQRAPEGWLTSEGEAAATMPDAAEVARRRALAGLAEQIDVAISSGFHARESESHAGMAVAQQARFESALDTSSAVELQGAEVLQRCAAGASVRARVGLDRERFSADARARLDQAASRIEQLISGSQSPFELAAALSSALPLAAAAERTAFVSSVVSRRPVAAAHSTARLRQRLQEAISRVGIRVEVESPSQVPLLSQIAQSCLGSVGVPAVAGPAEARLALAVVVQPASKVGEGLFVARANLSAVLRRGAATIGGAEAQLKAGGATAESAAGEAVRRLAVEQLPRVVDQTVAGLGWPLGSCAAGK